MNPKWQLYKELELIPDSEPEPQAPKGIFTTWFGNVWRSLCHFSTRKQEPEIWQRVDQEGNVWWDAFDPNGGQVMYFASEDEIRMWLDRLPYGDRF